MPQGRALPVRENTRKYAKIHKGYINHGEIYGDLIGFGF